MYNTNITEVELGMSCIVLIVYIVGKVWIHYKVDTNETKKPNNKKGVTNGTKN